MSQCPDENQQHNKKLEVGEIIIDIYEAIHPSNILPSCCHIYMSFVAFSSSL